jgi:hypothetical protein
MVRKGDYWDNAVAESFFYILKVALTYEKNCNTRQEAKTAISALMSTIKRMTLN